MSLTKQFLLNLLLFVKLIHGNLESNEVYQPTLEDELEVAMVASHIGFSGDAIPYEHEHDKRVELDILLTEEQLREMEDVDLQKRNALRDDRYRWKGNTVPYEISNDFSSSDKGVILNAINLWEDVTCLDFVERRRSSINYVNIIRGRGGCYSYVGSIGGAQELGLGRGCVFKRTVIHELGHALGLFHHQSRPDRDNFVEILFQNIRENLENQFRKLSLSTIDTFDTVYDYRSVMHYGQSFFSKNGRNTIRTRDPKYQDIIGRAPQMSFVDAKIVNAMYQCPQFADCQTNGCPGVGFRGKDCRCYCPANDGVDIVLCQGTDISTEKPTQTTTSSTTTTTTTTTQIPTTTEKSTTSSTTTTTVRPCDKMETTTSTTPPTSTSVPCRNKWRLRRCTNLKRRGMCTRSSRVRYNCQLTCNNCQGPSSSCTDKWPKRSCNSYRRYCNAWRTLKSNCRSTCRQC